MERILTIFRHDEIAEYIYILYKIRLVTHNIHENTRRNYY